MKTEKQQIQIIIAATRNALENNKQDVLRQIANILIKKAESIAIFESWDKENGGRCVGKPFSTLDENGSVIV